MLGIIASAGATDASWDLWEYWLEREATAAGIDDETFAATIRRKALVETLEGDGGAETVPELLAVGASLGRQGPAGPTLRQVVGADTEVSAKAMVGLETALRSTGARDPDDFGVCASCQEERDIFTTHGHAAGGGRGEVGEALCASCWDYIAKNEAGGGARVPAKCAQVSGCPLRVEAEDVAGIVPTSTLAAMLAHDTPDVTKNAAQYRDLVLRDEGLGETRGIGEGAMGICPYCLVVVGRRDGDCVYWWNHTCDPAQRVAPIVAKYEPLLDVGAVRTPGQLQLCIECGRPSVHKKHAALQQPGPDGKFAVIGGKDCVAEHPRREMVARMLAVRGVLSSAADPTSPAEEMALRTKAALAADAAPLDRELMAEAVRILAAEPAARNWGDAVCTKGEAVLQGGVYMTVGPSGQRGGKKRLATRKRPVRRRRAVARQTRQGQGRRRRGA